MTFRLPTGPPGRRSRLFEVQGLCRERLREIQALAGTGARRRRAAEPEAHSYRNASTGSRRAARHEGYSVARKESESARMTTNVTSRESISAGMRLRK